MKLRKSSKAKVIGVLLLTLAPFLATDSSAETEEKVTIGIVPEMNIFSQLERFQPLADYLKRKTGIDVRLKMLRHYDKIIFSLRDQDIDAAFLGSFTGAIAVSLLDATPLARPVNPDHTSTYHGHLFVRKDSMIKNTESMRGKTMAFVSRATTAGYVFPLAWLKEEGVDDYKTFFKGSFFAGSHDATIDAVLSGRADIGAAKNTIYDQYIKNNPQADKDLMVIASSTNVPSNGLCVMPTVSQETKMKLQNALLEMDENPQGERVLKKFAALEFVRTDAADYEPVIKLSKEAGLNLSDYLVDSGNDN